MKTGFCRESKTCHAAAEVIFCFPLALCCCETLGVVTASVEKLRNRVILILDIKETKP